jgi:hypothetical protein
MRYENGCGREEWAEEFAQDVDQDVDDDSEESSAPKKRARKSAPSFRPGSPEWFDHLLAIIWRTSVGNGNPFVNIEGYNVAIIQDHNQPGEYRYRIKDPQGNQTWSARKYDSIDAAKLPALKELARMLNA